MRGVEGPGRAHGSFALEHHGPQRSLPELLIRPGRGTSRIPSAKHRASRNRILLEQVRYPAGQLEEPQFPQTVLGGVGRREVLVNRPQGVVVAMCFAAQALEQGDLQLRSFEYPNTWIGLLCNAGQITAQEREAEVGRDSEPFRD